MVTAERNRSVDAIKGVLIFTVVLGHMLLGTLDNNPVRFLIYSFHMPAFFFISGYLLDKNKLKHTPIKRLCLKYWGRMLKPWMVAWIIYSIYACRNEINIFSLLHYLYSPYYHLWFVPSLFLSILLIAFILHKISNDTISVFLIFILGLFLYNLNSSEYHITGFISCYMIIFILLGIISRCMSEIAVRGGYHWRVHRINYYCR